MDAEQVLVCNEEAARSSNQAEMYDLATHQSSGVRGGPEEDDGALFVVSAAIGCSRREEQQLAVKRSVKLALENLGELRVFLSSTELMRVVTSGGKTLLKPRVFLPAQCAYIMGGRPIWSSAVWSRPIIAHQRRWYWLFAALCLLCAGLASGNRINVGGSGVRSWALDVASCSLMALVMIIQASTYSREGVRRVLCTFDFWYSFLHFLTLLFALSYVEWNKISSEWKAVVIPLRILAFTTMGFSLGTIDASPAPPSSKFAVSLLVSVVYFSWGFLWAVSTDKDSYQQVDFFVFSFTPRDLVRTSAWTIAIFSAKFAVKVAQGSDLMLMSVSHREISNTSSTLSQVEDAEGLPALSAGSRPFFFALLFVALCFGLLGGFGYYISSRVLSLL